MNEDEQTFTDEQMAAVAFTPEETQAMERAAQSEVDAWAKALEAEIAKSP